jgi:hypothetical protein
MATLTLLTRAIFRLVEFSSEGGWNSKLANDEAAFMVLDSLMVCIACGALTIGCVFIGKGRREGLEREGEGKDVDWEGRESVES